MSTHYRAAGTGVIVDIDPENAGWGYSGLRVIDLAPGESTAVHADGLEVLVLPLSGAATVKSGGADFQLTGRESVFTGVSDFLYVGRGESAVVTSERGGRFAFPYARTGNTLPTRYQPASAVPIELRGAGACSRQVNNFCTPDAFEADRLIACEVLTPAGNWSSYPPHKHDEEREGEAALEEIYYYEVADGPAGPGMAFQRVYSTDPARPIDVLEEVRSGDAVLIPHGWHGPSIAVPGYDLYYLNVMAGPGEQRAWLICDDPVHAWVRQTWVSQDIDPRLPMYTAK
jgi:5-deoxy-glucuronate isomerase